MPPRFFGTSHSLPALREARVGQGALLAVAFLSVALGAIVLTSISAPSAMADDWPEWLGPRRDGIWRETGIIDAFPAAGARVRWRTPIGAGYAGPAVARGRVYVMDRVLESGVRLPDDPFQRGALPGFERLLCLEEATGKLLWKHEYAVSYTVSYPSGPRVTPLVRDGRVYTLGAEGHVFALDAEKGIVLWTKSLREAYGVETPLWGFAATPLLDGNKLILLPGGKGTTVVALDRETGKELWRALEAREPGYAPPVIVEAGGRRQLIVWHPDALASLDPETGAPHWSVPFNVQSALTIATPRQEGDLLLVTSFYNGPLLVRLGKEAPSAEVVWRGTSSSEKKTDKLHAIMSTPFIADGHIYGVCSYGQLRCLELATGARVWETLQATGATGERGGINDRWANAFLVRQGGRVWIANERGDLILARLTPAGYEELTRAHVIEPTNRAQNRDVVWAHPAFANRSAYLRNDKEVVCVSLAQTE